MLSVFVCEDNKNYLEMISKCIEDRILIEELDMELILSTDDPAKIIQCIKNNKVNGLYFLDVELEGGYNGVEVARDIRQHDPRGFIVFITSHPKYLSLTLEYQVEALDYIQKTEQHVICEKISECILNAYEKHISRSSGGVFVFKTLNGNKISCEYKDILFFETDPCSSTQKRLLLHTIKRTYTICATLGGLFDELPKSTFFRSHKSCVVNIENLTEICHADLTEGKEKMVMPNGMDCKVSVRKRKDLLRLIKVMDSSVDIPITSM